MAHGAAYHGSYGQAMSRGAIRNATGASFFAWDSQKDVIGKPGGTQLKVSVTAAPLAGKATSHIVRFLAPLFGVAIADIKVVFGQEKVNKQLRMRAPQKLSLVFVRPDLATYARSQI